MGADNWAICPRCKSKHDEDAAKPTDAVAKSYGKVPASEYLANIEKAKCEKPLETSMREDWECGMDEDGNAVVYYGCSCDCGFGYRFRHEVKVPLSATWSEYEKRVQR